MIMEANIKWNILYPIVDGSEEIQEKEDSAINNTEWGA